MPVVEVAHRKEKWFLDHLSQLQAIPEVLEQIELSHGKVPFAVVSGGTRDAVIASLQALNLLDRFDTLVCAGDYQRGKPDPEPFLVAAARARRRAQGLPGVRRHPRWGIQSATAAGMASVKIPQPWERTVR